MRERKLRSGVNWQGALNKTGVKQVLYVLLHRRVCKIEWEVK